MHGVWKAGLSLAAGILLVCGLATGEEPGDKAANPPALVYARSVDEPQGFHVTRTVVALWSDGLCYRRVCAGDPIVGYLDDGLMDCVTREVLELAAAMEKHDCRTLGMPGQAMQRIRATGMGEEVAVAWHAEVERLFVGEACGDPAATAQFLTNWMRALDLENDCVPRAPLDKQSAAKLLLTRPHGVNLK